ncbi:hypothetical protein ACW9IT_17160, partial [Pseudomonas sp. SDO5511_1_S431]
GKLSGQGHDELHHFQGHDQLESAITAFMALRNAQPTRYVWNAKGEEILNKIQRAREALEAVVNK